MAFKSRAFDNLYASSTKAVGTIMPNRKEIKKKSKKLKRGN
jgi:hypothetical protein